MLYLCLDVGALVSAVPEPSLTELCIFDIDWRVVVSAISSRDASFSSSDLQFNVENHEQDMIGRMTTLLPAEKQQISRNILPRRDTFEVLYHLHFDNLCAGRIVILF